MYTQNSALNASDKQSFDLSLTKVGSKEPAAAAGSNAPTLVFRDAILELSEAFKAEFCVQGQCRPGRLDILQRINPIICIQSLMAATTKSC